MASSWASVVGTNSKVDAKKSLAGMNLVPLHKLRGTVNGITKDRYQLFRYYEGEPYARQGQ
jgi:hypothetical protein